MLRREFFSACAAAVATIKSIGMVNHSALAEDKHITKNTAVDFIRYFTVISVKWTFVTIEDMKPHRIPLPSKGISDKAIEDCIKQYKRSYPKQKVCLYLFCDGTGKTLNCLICDSEKVKLGARV